MAYNDRLIMTVNVNQCYPIKLGGFLSLIINLLSDVYDRLCCLSNVKLS